MDRCPNCWSTVQPRNGRCPECDSPWPAGSGTPLGRWLGLAGLLLAAGGGAAWWALREDPAAQAERTDAADARTTPAAAATPEAPAAGRASSTGPASGVLTLPGSDYAVLLVGPRGGGFLLASTELLIRAERPEVAGITYPLRLVHADPAAELSLFALYGAPSAGPTAWRVAASEEPPPLLAWLPEADRAIVLRARAGDGSRSLADRLSRLSEVAAGSVIVAGNRGGRREAVGWIDGDARLHELERWLPWLGRPPLADTAVRELRARLRSERPELLLDDLRRLATAEAPPPGRPLRTAGWLREVATIARQVESRGWLRSLGDVESVRTLCATLRSRQIAAQWSVDQAVAIAVADAALALYPDSPEVVLAALELRLARGAGNALAAADLIDRLTALGGAYPTERRWVLSQALERDAAAALAAGDAATAIVVASRWAGLEADDGDAWAMLAKAQRAAGQLPAAIQSATTAASLDAGAHASLLQTLQRSADPGVVTVPIDPRTRSATAEVQIGGQRLRAIVDTGASITTVPTAVANRLGLIGPDSRRVQVTTASGVEEGRLVRLPNLQLGSLRLNDVEAIALDLPGGLRGGMLLGMSALERWSVEVDGAAGEIVIRGR